MSNHIARMIVDPGTPTGTVNPNIYDHFAEHLGR
jgi:hypothetical protein